MILSRLRKHLPTSLLLIAACTTATLAGWSFEFQLNQNKKTIGKSLTRNAVVEFDDVLVSRKRVKLGDTFDGNEDWLSEVFLKVKNVSTKPIIYLEVNVNFPETRANGAMSSYMLTFGQRPGFNVPLFNAPLLIPPAATFDITLESVYPQMKQFVERRKLMKSISKAELEIGFVVFEDKTAWAAGSFLKQDPNNLGHYINVGAKPIN